MVEGVAEVGRHGGLGEGAKRHGSTPPARQAPPPRSSKELRGGRAECTPEATSGRRPTGPSAPIRDSRSRLITSVIVVCHDRPLLSVTVTLVPQSSRGSAATASTPARHAPDSVTVRSPDASEAGAGNAKGLPTRIGCSAFRAEPSRPGLGHTVPARAAGPSFRGASHRTARRKAGGTGAGRSRAEAGRGVLKHRGQVLGVA